MKKLISKFVALGLGAFLSTSASAALIASFNEGGVAYTGDGPAGTPTTWTNNPFIGPVVDSASDVSYGLVGGWNAAIAANAGSTTSYDNLTDTLSATTGSATFSIGNLDPFTLYDIYVISANAEGFGAGNIYGGVYTVTTGTGGSASAVGVGNGESAWVEGDNYALLTNVASDGTGLVVITATPNAASPNPGAAGIAGVQIVEVPEPGSLALLGIGGLLIARRRRG